MRSDSSFHEISVLFYMVSKDGHLERCCNYNRSHRHLDTFLTKQLLHVSLLLVNVRADTAVAHNKDCTTNKVESVVRRAKLIYCIMS